MQLLFDTMQFALNKKNKIFLIILEVLMNSHYHRVLIGNKFVLLREIKHVWIGLNKLDGSWKFSDGSDYHFVPRENPANT